MGLQDPRTRVNSIFGLLQIILIPINNQLLLQGKIKERQLTVEETSNHRHYRQVILVVIETHTQATMTMMMIKEETMAGAEKADIGNVTLEDHRFLETHLPVREPY